MKKKILFTAYNLDIGGIETSLVSILNKLATEYEISLVLEEKSGIFLNQLNKSIKLIEYKPSNKKNIFLRKSINFVKRIKFTIFHRNKYFFSASFATYSRMGAFCALTASKNNALWVHTDYLAFYNNNESEVKDFFKCVKYKKFKKIVCVSNAAASNLKKVLNCNNIQVINNLLDYKIILDKSKENIDFKKDSSLITFVNISRHDEMSKKITRIITVAKRLKEDKLKFRILLIGQGKDTALYKEMTKNYNVEDCVIFLGQKENPYPYFNISDCFILTSDFEGYPVVFNECKTLNLPIITTDVSDAKIDIEGSYGIVTNKDTESIYQAMKNFINTGYTIKNKFNAEEYNSKIINKLEVLMDGGCHA